MRAGFLNLDSAVEGEAKSKAQAFRSERNGPVPLSQVASSGARAESSTVVNGVLSRKNDFETLRCCAFAAPAHASSNAGR